MYYSLVLRINRKKLNSRRSIFKRKSFVKMSMTWFSVQLIPFHSCLENIQNNKKKTVDTFKF